MVRNFHENSAIKVAKMRLLHPLHIYFCPHVTRLESLILLKSFL
jgi:hypothetical protein